MITAERDTERESKERSTGLLFLLSFSVFFFKTGRSGLSLQTKRKFREEELTHARADGERWGEKRR